MALTVVPGPAERGGLKGAVLDGEVGAVVDEELDHGEVAVKGGAVQGGLLVAVPVGSVGVEAELDHEGHGIEAVLVGRDADLMGGDRPLDDRRVLTAEPGDPGRSARMQAPRNSSTESVGSGMARVGSSSPRTGVLPCRTASS